MEEYENAICVGETDKGIWVSLPDLLDEDIFIPDSHVSDDSEVYKKGTKGTLIITNWIAKKKGLADE
jgi:hypothetical protein